MNASSLESADSRKKLLLAFAIVAASLAAMTTCALIAFYFDGLQQENVFGKELRLAVLMRVARPLAIAGCALLYFILCWRAEKRAWLTVLPMALYFSATAVFFLGFKRSLSAINVIKYGVCLLFVLVCALTLAGLLKGAGRWITLVIGAGCVGLRVYVFAVAAVNVFSGIGVVSPKAATANVVTLLPYCSELLLLAAMILHPFFRRVKAAPPPAEAEPEPAAVNE